MTLMTRDLAHGLEGRLFDQVSDRLKTVIDLADEAKKLSPLRRSQPVWIARLQLAVAMLRGDSQGITSSCWELVKLKIPPARWGFLAVQAFRTHRELLPIPQAGWPKDRSDWNKRSHLEGVIRRLSMAEVRALAVVPR